MTSPKLQHCGLASLLVVCSTINSRKGDLTPHQVVTRAKVRPGQADHPRLDLLALFCSPQVRPAHGDPLGQMIVVIDLFHATETFVVGSGAAHGNPAAQHVRMASFAEQGLRNFWEAITCDLSQHARLLEPQ
jgi:hypothetical protein